MSKTRYNPLPSGYCFMLDAMNSYLSVHSNMIDQGYDTKYMKSYKHGTR